MDILSLSLKANTEVKSAFGLEKTPKTSFADGFAGAKGLAPPGTAPPPNTPLAKSGEEGATPEPIAPTQNPDFSPDLTKEINLGDSTILIDFDPQTFKPCEPIKVGDLKPRDDSSAACLQTFGCLGAIVLTHEELPVSADLATDSVQLKPEAGAEPTKKIPPTMIDPTGERPKPWEFAIDFPTKPDPIEQLSGPFNGERPKKPIDPSKDGEKFPVVTPKPWNVTNSDPVASANGSRPRIVSDDASVDSVKVDKHDPSQTLNRPIVIKLGNDVDTDTAITELNGQRRTYVTDPYFPEKPVEGEVKETAIQKEPVKIGPASDDVKASDAAKGDPTKQGDGSNSNRPLRAIPKPEIKIDSEQEEIKVQAADSKPSAEAIAKPRPIASDNAPQKPDLTPKQSDEVVRQVLDRIDALATSRSGRKVTIHLDPKEFGSITLVVGRRGGEVDAEIYASNDRVRHALETNRPNLAAGLDQRGIQLSSMTVGSQLPHGSGRQEQELHDMARQQHQNMSRFERTETTTLSIDAIRGLSRKATGVDLWT